MGGVTIRRPGTPLAYCKVLIDPNLCLRASAGEKSISEHTPATDNGIKGYFVGEGQSVSISLRAQIRSITRIDGRKASADQPFCFNEHHRRKSSSDRKVFSKQKPESRLNHKPGTN
ncbi:hypothetical protein RvY_18038 [Ramazzottius varieornatus]|uniref:Uncharacterized protein n=1 Tax=Ramazzottius varieornatus TaxID=947166 RepID=A0A1D1W4Y6_RAMVA|nr:hypothetical protein RvY_18038 [Ramazzottius varieornatus]